MNVNPRIVVAALSLSAAAFIGIARHEYYVAEAMIPTINDRPTVGLGSTFYEDGSPVKMGDKIKPVRAIVLAGNHLGKEENKFRASLPDVKLSQAEYDIYVDWTYQYGSGAWMKSSMLRELKAGNYAAACDALLAYKFSGGYDCSTPGNRICRGVWDRQLERHAKCMAAQ